MSVELSVFVEPRPKGVCVKGTTRGAFEALYRQCSKDLVAFCRRQLCGTGDPEAVAQEAFVRAWTSFDRFSPERPFWPWLATIARRLCIDQRRRLERELAHVQSPMAPADAQCPDELYEASEEYRSAYEALSRLKPAERRVITLRDLNGWSYDEIARAEGVTVESIRGSLKRARTSLRRSYADVAGGLAAALPGFADAFRRRFEALSTRRLGTYQAANVLPLPSFHDVVALAFATFLVAGGTDIVVQRDRPVRSRPAASAASGGGVEMTRSVAAAALPRMGTHGARLLETADGETTMTTAAPLDLLDDGARSPDVTDVSSFTVAPDQHGTRTVFAVATVLNCSNPPCAALFRSTDGGESWVRLPAAGFIGGAVLLSPSYPDDGRVFVAGPAGLQESRDGGATFASLAAVGGTAAISPRFNEGDPRIVVGAAPVWEYRDDTRLARPAVLPLGPPLGGAGVAFGPDGRELLIGGTALDASGRQAGAVYRCVPSACSHVALDGLIGPPRLAVAGEGRSDGTAFAWRGTALFRSPDGGRTFARSVLPVRGTVADVTVLPSGRVFVAVAPAQEVGAGGLFASDDSGLSWFRLGAGTRLDAGVRTVAALGEDRLLAAPSLEGGAGVLCSADGGQTWSSRCAR